MIKVTRAKECRARDRKLHRLALTIGGRTFRITREEARKLRNALNRFSLDGLLRSFR